jgi:hypothetical protein
LLSEESATELKQPLKPESLDNIIKDLATSSCSCSISEVEDKEAVFVKDNEEV